jgi:hypothetical protein
MTFFHVCILITNIFIVTIVFVRLFNRRKVFQDRFAMIMAATISGTISFSLALVIYFLIPSGLAVISLITTAVGGFIGICFGSLVKLQSVLSGLFHGIVGGIMGTMLGAVIEDPTLCSLPASYIDAVAQNMVIFPLFSSLLTVISSSLVLYALRV